MLKSSLKDTSIPSLCERLVQSKLISPGRLEGLMDLWRTEASDSTSIHRFCKWLRKREYVTEYQLAMLIQGHLEHFFFGPYKILERTAKGRLAVVYKAVNPQGDYVAIKVLPPSRARDPQLLNRFQEHARCSCSLSHPNIVNTLEASESNGLHYLVMEYLEGETLQQRLEREKQLPLIEAVALIRQAMAGLQYLHEKGLVHRNLEPTNLMLVPSRDKTFNTHDSFPTVKILDICLNQSFFAEETSCSESYLFSTYESTLHTPPDYLAPEQANQTSTDVRSDIYSLGCILYHAIAGVPPFHDSNPLNQILRHATEQPRPLQDFNDQVPKGLQRIVDWMMAKSPEDRYASPDQAVNALEFYLVGNTEVNSVHQDQAPSAVESTPEVKKEELPPPQAYLQEPPSLLEQPSYLEDATANSTILSEEVELVLLEPMDQRKAKPAPVTRPELFTRRDYLLLILGACGVLTAQLFGWVMARLIP